MTDHPTGRYALLLVLAWPLALGAQQLETPPASPPAILTQRVGFTDITIRYARPGVKGRRIFGELLPYGRVWRTGANESTRVSFSRPVTIGEQQVAAGTYSLYTIPGEREWTWILNRDTSLWGDRGYDPARDALRLTSPVEPLADRVETLDLRWMNLSFQSADLVLEWEYTRVRLPLRFDTDQEVDARIARVLAGRPSGEDYYRAARYYLDNDRDLATARDWIDKRVAMDGEQFGILRYQALLEYRTGDTAAARRTLDRSLELARQAGNDHYVRMNEQTRREWQTRPAPLPAGEILRRSIAYHDPAGAWAAGRFELSLFEERPGSAYRLTDLLIDNASGIFRLDQHRGRDHIWREVGPDGCRVRLNGSAEPTQEQIRSFNLPCAASHRMRDYYTYLWGLPMKLRDPGTLIAPDARLVDFFGQECYEIKVSYDPNVGGDTWYFYFAPETFALLGYRFYHDEDRNDGEYILLSGEAPVGPLRLPARREWYTNSDRLFLGADELIIRSGY